MTEQMKQILLQANHITSDNVRFYLNLSPYHI